METTYFESQQFRKYSFSKQLDPVFVSRKLQLAHSSRNVQSTCNKTQRDDIYFQTWHVNEIRFLEAILQSLALLT